MGTTRASGCTTRADNSCHEGFACSGVRCIIYDPRPKRKESFSVRPLPLPNCCGTRLFRSFLEAIARLRSSGFHLRIRSKSHYALTFFRDHGSLVWCWDFNYPGRLSYLVEEAERGSGF